MKNKNIFKKIGGELLFGILGIVATTIETKIGFGIFLIIVGLSILLSPKTQGVEESIQNIVGIILLTVAFLLFIWRIEELKNQNKN